MGLVLINPLGPPTAPLQVQQGGARVMGMPKSGIGVAIMARHSFIWLFNMLDSGGHLFVLNTTTLRGYNVNCHKDAIMA
jgi:hypothetical protein